MSYSILFSQEAQEHLADFAAHDRRIIIQRIQSSLIELPSRETRNLKLLRPNPVARYELRIGKYRVFFDPDEINKVVRVLAIGYKEGNVLRVGHTEVSL